MFPKLVDNIQFCRAAKFSAGHTLDNYQVLSSECTRKMIHPEQKTAHISFVVSIPQW